MGFRIRENFQPWVWSILWVYFNNVTLESFPKPSWGRKKDFFHQPAVPEGHTQGQRMGVWGSSAVLSPDQQLFSFPRALVTPLAILRLTRSPVGLENKTTEIGKGSTYPPPLRFLSLSMGVPPETGLASPCPSLTEQCTPSDGKFGYALPVSLSYSWEWATGRKQDLACFFVRMGEPSQHVQWVTKPVQLCWSVSQPTWSHLHLSSDSVCTCIRGDILSLIRYNVLHLSMYWDLKKM